MARTNFKPRTINSSNRKSFTINQFLGVDYSTHKFEIENNRAIDILNYIYKDGVIQNRNGITQIFEMKSTKYFKLNFDGTYITNVLYDNETNINNIWQFVGEDNKVHIIAHIGKLLYEIFNIDDEYNIKIELIKNTIYNGFPVCYEYENYKSQAFVGGNKLWFLGGNKYMVLRYMENSQPVILPVEQSDLVQIPTTTINITYENAKVSQRNSLDNVNLLTKWRKNKLLSGKGKNDNISYQYYEYTLDSPMISENNKDMLDFEMIIEERGVIKNG